jgi:hypothetical protein
MIRKHAELAVLDAWRVPAGGSKRALVKAAHRVSFAYTPRPGYLYVRARAISSRTNDNWDTFPAKEIEKGYRTFLGKPCFINHHNSNHRRARGVIVAAAMHHDRNPDGSPDTWVELLHEIDAQVFPKFAKAVLTGRVNRTSMGVDCEYSTCSACGNRATSPAEYCSHMPGRKGMKFRRRNTKTGKLEEGVIHEICAGLTFFENSFLVEDPADPTAHVLDKPYLHATAAVRATASAAADDDNLYALTGCHHTSCGRTLHRGRTARVDIIEDRLHHPADPPAEPSRLAIAGARTYSAAHGLPDPHTEPYSRIETNPDRIRRLAHAYDALPMNDPGAHAAFADMARQVRQQYHHLTHVMGVHVEPVHDDPYADHHEMLSDLQDNGRLKVLSTAATGPHTFFDDDTNDQFRAVHDAFGHAATGRTFDRHGEEAAWLAHSQMFSGPARHAMTTETRGQNSMLIATGRFPPQKTALLDPSFTRREAARHPGLLEHFAAAGRREGAFTPSDPLYHGTRSVLAPGEQLTVGEAERYPNNADIRTDPYVHATTDPAEAGRWGERADSGQAAERARELGRQQRQGPGENEDQAYRPRVYRVHPTGSVEPDLEYADTEHDSYRSAHPMRVGEEVRPLYCHAEECGNAEHWPDHPHYQMLKDEDDEEEERWRERHGTRRQAITGAEPQPGHEVWAEPQPGRSPVAAELEHNMTTREPHSWYRGLSYHGPYHVIRHPQARTVHVVDAQGRSADPMGHASFGNPERDGRYGEDQAYELWHHLESAGPDAHRIGTEEEPRFSEVAKERTPAFPHSRTDPEDVERAARPDARVHKPEGHSPGDEWHGPYEVVKHPETGEFHVVDNAGRQAPGMSWRGHPTQMHAERSRDYIDRRQQSKDLGRSLADKIWSGGEEALDPGGTAESRQSEENTRRGSELMGRYAGGRGQIKFEPDEEGGRPYYEREHLLPGGQGSGWYAKHYGGSSADMYHRATGGISHDQIHLPADQHGQLSPDFDDIELGRHLQAWHDQPDGMRRHVENQDWQSGGDERIQRWKRRRLGAIQEHGTHCTNCGTPFGYDASDFGNMRNSKLPHLCNDCVGGYRGRTVYDQGKKPIDYASKDLGGAGSSQRLMRQVMEQGAGRAWTPDDAMKQSLSSLRAEAAPRYADPADHPWFKAIPLDKDNIKAAWYDSTDDEKTQGRNWYPDAHLVAKSIAHGDAALGAGLLSAYSPRTKWPANMFHAARTIHLGRALSHSLGDGAIMDMHTNPAARILAGEHHSQVLNGPKTRSFATLIEHGGQDPEDTKNGVAHVVVDRHAMSVAAGRRLTDKEAVAMPVDKEHYYHHVEQKYLDAADEVSRETGQKVTPEHMQATTWLRQVRVNDAEDSSVRNAFGGGGRVQKGINDQRRWQEHVREHHPELEGQTMHASLRHTAADPPLRVPPSVDTLRPEACPVCGDQDVFKGQRCPVCGFVAPPDIFRDPDIEHAKMMREQLEETKETSPFPEGPADEEQAVPGAEPGMNPPVGSGEDADEQLFHPDQIAPDGVPGVQPDATAPGQGMLEPTGDEEALAEPGELDAEGQPVSPEQEEIDEADPEGAAVREDAEAQEDEAMAGQLDVKAEGEEEAATEEEEQAEGGSPGKDQDEDERPGGKKMTKQRTAATAAVTAQQRVIDELRRENAGLHAGLAFIASLAGVTEELDAVLKQADLANPAQPVDDPPQGPPVQTTEEALQTGAPTGSGNGLRRGPGHTEDDPSRPGATPGSMTAVPAEATTTAITPGADLPTPPANQLVDVTAPVQGTNPSQDGGVPIEQRRIETDVRVNPNPLAAQGPGIGGQGNDGTAFPWTIAARETLQSTAAMSPEDERGARTFAAIRLAKLRITAGLVRGDELELATHIERDAALSLHDIEREIQTLGQVSKAAAVAQAQPRYPRTMAPRTAARTAPSFSGEPAPMMAMTAGATGYDSDDGDLFD